MEDSGIKHQKHGEPNLANELRQAMLELFKIANYYHIEKELEDSIQASLQRSKESGLTE